MLSVRDGGQAKDALAEEVAEHEEDEEEVEAARDRD